MNHTHRILPFRVPRPAQAPRSRPCALVFAACIVALLLAGCGRSATSLDTWKHDLNRYVQQQCSGDPAELRNLPAPAGVHRFASIQKDAPVDSTDTVGVLLGHRAVAGRPTFIFLVAVIDHENVTDIRVAAMTVPPRISDDLLCQFSNPDAAALNTYRARHTPGDPKRRALTDWPTGAEHFTLDVTGSIISVTDTVSNAHWSLAVVAAK